MERQRRTLLILTGFLLAIGLVMVYSAGFVTAERKYGDSTFFLKRHSIYVMLGCLALGITAGLDYHRVCRHWKLWLAAAFLLLVIVLIPDIGKKFNGARRWISFGSLTIQPSEIAKILLILGMSGWAVTRGRKIQTFVKGFIPALFLIGGACALIAVEPDLGTAALTAATLAAILFVAGIRLRHVIPTFLVTAPIAVFLAWNKLGYVRARWETFVSDDIDPLGKGYHITQAMIAQGSGGWFGTGPGLGRSKLLFLPEAHNDFILAVVGEELGLVGALAIVFCFMLFAWTGMQIARKAPDRLGTLLAVGVTLVISLQAAMHIAVVTHSMPTKGIGLPLVSYGGSSLIMMLAGVGVLLNVAAHPSREELKQVEMFPKEIPTPVPNPITDQVPALGG